MCYESFEVLLAKTFSVQTIYCNYPEENNKLRFIDLGLGLQNIGSKHTERVYHLEM